MVQCPHPDCEGSDKEFQSDVTMRQHHTTVHGEQLPNSTCDHCGTNFFRKGGGKYCDDCWEENKNVGEFNPNHSDSKEEATCESCGEIFEYYPSSKEGLGCPECIEQGYNPTEMASGEDSQFYDHVTVQCEVCGDDITRQRSRIERNETGRFFCQKSPRCTQASWRRRNLETHYERDYGPNWLEMQRKCRERDNYECQLCGKEQDENGRKLDVHHIVPFFDFDSYNEANRIQNLVTLCRECHMDMEFGVASLPEHVVNKKNLVSATTENSRF